jgi:hypothetical protein
VSTGALHDLPLEREGGGIANRVIVATQWTLRDSFGHRFSQQQMIRLVNKQRPAFKRKPILAVLDAMSDPADGRYQRLNRHVEGDQVSYSCREYADQYSSDFATSIFSK